MERVIIVTKWVNFSLPSPPLGARLRTVRENSAWPQSCTSWCVSPIGWEEPERWRLEPFVKFFRTDPVRTVVQFPRMAGRNRHAFHHVLREIGTEKLPQGYDDHHQILKWLKHHEKERRGACMLCGPPGWKEDGLEGPTRWVCKLVDAMKSEKKEEEENRRFATWDLLKVPCLVFNGRLLHVYNISSVAKYNMRRRRKKTMTTRLLQGNTPTGADRRVE